MSPLPSSNTNTGHSESTVLQEPSALLRRPEQPGVLKNEPHPRPREGNLAIPRQDEQLHLLEEDEFLPSLSRWVTFGGMGMVLLLGAAVFLASVFKFSDTVKAPAIMRPVGELKVAQSAVEGVIEQIYVQENQAIREGDIVARLDDSRLKSKINQLYTELQRSTMQTFQINSQLRSIDSQMVAETNMMNRMIAASEASVLEQQNNYENLRASALADYEEASATLSLASQEMESYRAMEAAGAVPKLAVRQKETAVAEASARVRKLRALMNPTSAPIVRAKESVLQEQARGEASIAALRQQRDQFFQNRVAAQNQVERSQIEIRQAEKELKGTIVRATADGTILQLNLRNPGQVVQAGQAIAQIAPPNYALLIKAQVSSGDINKVEKGAEVQMRVNGCSYTEYGTLKGTVKNISADTVAAAASPTADNTPAAAKSAAYEVTIQPKALFLGTGANTCRLKFGMDGRADIITKKETVLTFILKKARLLADA